MTMKKNKKILAGIGIFAGTCLFFWFMEKQGSPILKSLKFLSVLYSLLFLGWMDIKTRKIPNKILLLMLFLRFLFFFAETVLDVSFVRQNLVFMLAGGMLAGGILLICRLVSRDSIGMGDIKLFIVLGMYFGYDILYVMFFSFLCSALYSLFMMAGKKITKKDTIPLAPFVWFGTVLSILLI